MVVRRTKSPPTAVGGLGRQRVYFASSAVLMALVRSSESGATADLKRPATLPSRPIRNFSKFQPTSSTLPSFGVAAVRILYSSTLSFPFTPTLEVIGKVTLYFEEQNFWISSSVPGSCLPKSLAGTPRTTSPSFSYFEYSFCNPSYWGV